MSNATKQPVISASAVGFGLGVVAGVIGSWLAFTPKGKQTQKKLLADLEWLEQSFDKLDWSGWRNSEFWEQVLTQPSVTKKRVSKSTSDSKTKDSGSKFKGT